MQICGIIVEYNPLTNGHLYHISKAKELTGADVLIAVMSGNFTQRGEPAIVDKWQRSRAAVLNGVDLVFELPFAFACESADYFAKGAIAMLKALGAQTIVFGTETLEKADFEQLYQDSKTAAYQTRLQELLKQGCSFPQAASQAFENQNISCPNDLLGFAYVKEIARQKADINYLTIHRQTDYHSQEITSASASALRKALKEGKRIEAFSPMRIEGPLHDIEELYEPLYQRLSFAKPEELSQIHLMNEGLEYRMIEKITDSTDMTSFLNLVTTRRYTTPRVLRTIIHLLINDTSQERANEEIGYLRLLGASIKGQQALRALKKQCPLPIISTFAEISHPHLTLELAAAKLYALALPPEERRAAIMQEYSHPPFIQKNHQ